MVPTECSNRRKPSCRDKGRSGVDERAWCLSWWGCDRLASPNPDQRHASRTSTRPPPCSTSTPCPYRMQADLPTHSPIRVAKIIRVTVQTVKDSSSQLNHLLAYKVTTDFLLEEPWRTESRIRYAYPTITVRPKSHCATDIPLSFALGRLWEEEKPSATVGVAAQL